MHFEFYYKYTWCPSYWWSLLLTLCVPYISFARCWFLRLLAIDLISRRPPASVLLPPSPVAVALLKCLTASMLLIRPLPFLLFSEPLTVLITGAVLSCGSPEKREANIYLYYCMAVIYGKPCDARNPFCIGTYYFWIMLDTKASFCILISAKLRAPLYSCEGWPLLRTI